MEDGGTPFVLKELFTFHKPQRYKIPWRPDVVLFCWNRWPRKSGLRKGRICVRGCSRFEFILSTPEKSTAGVHEPPDFALQKPDKSLFIEANGDGLGIPWSTYRHFGKVIAIH